MIALKIANILNARGIDKHFTFLVNSGFSEHMAHKLLNPRIASVRLKDLEQLCRLLVCEPNDLMVFNPNDNRPLPQNHPLHNLIKDEATHKILNNTLRQLPYKDLMNISNQIHSTITNQKEKPSNNAELS